MDEQEEAELLNRRLVLRLRDALDTWIDSTDLARIHTSIANYGPQYDRHKEFAEFAATQTRENKNLLISAWRALGLEND